MTERSGRIVAARKLKQRRHRNAFRRFLAEGPQAVNAALDAGAVIDVFATRPDLIAHDVTLVTEKALITLAETVNSQGVVAVCEQRDVPLEDAVDARLVVILSEISDPGNAGTILRTADACGADLVVFTAGSVDPYNGKAVRASAGSVFHVPIARAGTPAEVVKVLRDRGLRVLAAEPRGETPLDTIKDLDQPTAWLFGSEAHGLAPSDAALADARVRVPIRGRAESLNLAAAAAICLYATANAQSAHRTHP